MKQTLLFLLFLPVNSFACIVGPAQLAISESNGFEVVQKTAELQESTDEINIVGPLEYKGKRFEMGIYSIYLEGVLVARSIHSSINESGEPEFLGYVSNRQGFSYSVSFLYGEGRCKEYEFTASTRVGQS